MLLSILGNHLFCNCILTRTDIGDHSKKKNKMFHKYGYKVSRRFCLTIFKAQAVLVPLKVSDEYLRHAKIYWSY